MKVYCMSDIHGCYAEFETALSYFIDKLDEDDVKLVLLGDYIHGGAESYEVLDRIMELQDRYGCEKVIALLGNHEEMAMNGQWHINEHYVDGDKDSIYFEWMNTLPYYHVEGKTIFTHAGIDEDAGEYWEECTGEHTFIWKYPAEVGKIDALDMKVVAGHVGTSEIAENPSFHDIYYDGKSHYYIDGTVRKSGVIPVLLIDTETDKYYRVTECGQWLILPYSKDN